MELILWRHAEAEDGGRDLERRLTAKGRKDAERVAAWLLRRLPAGFEVVASPAARAQETAQALGTPVRTDSRLAPGASVEDILEAGKRSGLAVIVGHQPDLGRALARLVAGTEADWPLEKGALWWIEKSHVKAVVAPELL